MRAFLSFLNRLFDWVFLPLAWAGPFLTLLAVSLLTGILMLALFRFTSNQKQIKHAKEQMQAHLLAIRLFQDQLRVVFESHGRVLRWMLVYLRCSLRPLAVLLVPVVLLMVQLETRLGWEPIRTEDSFVVTAVLVDPSDLERTSLRLPPGLLFAAPPVRIADRREITWKLSSREPGTYPLQVAVGEQEFSKQVVVGRRTQQLSPRRVRNQGLEAFFYPVEPAMPREAPLEWIEVRYPSRRIDLGVTQTHWMLPFLLFSILFGFLFRGWLRTEI